MQKRRPTIDLDELARARIVQWRQDAGLSQMAFGAAIKRNNIWVSRYECGKYDASFDMVRRMAEALGHTLFQALDLRERADKREAEVVTVYRAIAKRERDFALAVWRTVGAGLKGGKTNGR